jgi:hypothetical protein
MRLVPVTNTQMLSVSDSTISLSQEPSLPTRQSKEKESPNVE